MSQGSGITNILVSTNSAQALPLLILIEASWGFLAKTMALTYVSCPQWLSETMVEDSMTSSIFLASKTSITCRTPLSSATCLGWRLATLDQLQQHQYAEESGEMS